jgi:ribosomal-protein-alanine N-acetyltransferase
MATARAPSPFQIRAGTPADAPAIERLSIRAFDPGFREAWNARQIVQALSSAGGFLLIAEAEALEGFALSRAAADDCELMLCAVAPEARRAGIARALVAATLAEARRRGLSRIYLEVRESNLPARRFYEAMGFQPVGLRPGYYRSVTGQSVAALTLSRGTDVA